MSGNIGLQLTTAGASALSLALAANTDVAINKIGLGAFPTPPNTTAEDVAAYTELRDLKEKFTINSTTNLGAGLRALEGRAIGNEAYSVTEIGLYMSNGVLFAVILAGYNSVLNEKTTGTLPVVIHTKFGSAVDATVSIVSPNSATIPSATSLVPGIFRLADTADVNEMNDAAVVTPYTLGLMSRTGNLAKTLASTLIQAVHDLSEVYAQPAALTVYKASLLEKYLAGNLVIIGTNMYRRTGDNSTPTSSPGSPASVHWVTYDLEKLI